MNPSERISPPLWYWIVSVLALLWNLLGLMAFVMQLLITEEMLSQMPEAERQMLENLPGWIYIPFAVAVIGGTLGCVGLLLRQRWASPVLILSLIGVIIQNGYSWTMTDALSVYGPQAMILPIMVIGIGVFLIWLVNFAVQKRWIA